MIRGIIFPTQDVALAQRRDQDVLDIGSEYLAVDRPVYDPRGGDCIMAQGGDEEPAPDLIRGHGVPVPERGLADQAFALCGPTAQRGHVGLGPCFVNEHQSFQVDTTLMGLPALALAGHIRAVLLTGQSGFF